MYRSCFLYSINKHLSSADVLCSSNSRLTGRAYMINKRIEYTFDDVETLMGHASADRIRLPIMTADGQELHFGFGKTGAWQ